MSVLLYGSTTRTLKKCTEKRLDENNTRMLRIILDNSWKQHPTKQQLYCHLPPISQTIQVGRTRDADHCWRSKDELISIVLLCITAHKYTSVSRPANNYIHQLCANTGCSLVDLLGAMNKNNRDGWWERERERGRESRRTISATLLLLLLLLLLFTNQNLRVI